MSKSMMAALVAVLGLSFAANAAEKKADVKPTTEAGAEATVDANATPAPEASAEEAGKPVAKKEAK